MYVIFLQCIHCVKKTLTVSCTLLCESGDRVMVDQSSFSADLHAVMLRHHCSGYAVSVVHNWGGMYNTSGIRNSHPPRHPSPRKLIPLEHSSPWNTHPPGTPIPLEHSSPLELPSPWNTHPPWNTHHSQLVFYVNIVPSVYKVSRYIIRS